MTGKREERRRKIRELQHDGVRMAKSRLMDVQDEMEQLSPPMARRLGMIIGKLEAWQNRKV